MSEIHKATQAFMFVDGEGVHRHVNAGDLMSSDDPGFKGRESLFEKVEVSVNRADAARHGDVAIQVPSPETASAAPDEPKRSMSRPSRSKTKDSTGSSE